jgi:hypothetical protein
VTLKLHPDGETAALLPGLEIDTQSYIVFCVLHTPADCSLILCVTDTHNLILCVTDCNLILCVTDARNLILCVTDTRNLILCVMCNV